MCEYKLRGMTLGIRSIMVLHLLLIEMQSQQQQQQQQHLFALFVTIFLIFDKLYKRSESTGHL